MQFNPRNWGGRRPGAGRPRSAKCGLTNERPGVPHLRRPALSHAHPVHVTLRLRRAMPTLRQRTLANAVFAAFRWMKKKAEADACVRARLVEYSVQTNHLHLIVEAADARSLARAMQGLGISLARRLNSRLGRRGGVLADRYHARQLRTPTQVRRALVYVLQNYRRHGATHPKWSVDPFSSAPYFAGFKSRLFGWPLYRFVPPKDPPITPARTWLLRAGWQRLGLLDRRERPRAPG